MTAKWNLTHRCVGSGLFSFGPHLLKKYTVGSVPVSGLEQQPGLPGKDPLCSLYHLVLALPSR